MFLSRPVSSCYLQLQINFLLSDFPYNLSLLHSQRRSFISPSFHSPFRFEGTYVTLHRFAFFLACCHISFDSSSLRMLHDVLFFSDSSLTSAPFMPWSLKERRYFDHLSRLVFIYIFSLCLSFTHTQKIHSNAVPFILNSTTLII